MGTYAIGVFLYLKNEENPRENANLKWQMCLHSEDYQKAQFAATCRALATYKPVAEQLRDRLPAVLVKAKEKDYLS